MPKYVFIIFCQTDSGDKLIVEKFAAARGCHFKPHALGCIKINCQIISPSDFLAQLFLTSRFELMNKLSENSNISTEITYMLTKEKDLCFH